MTLRNRRALPILYLSFVVLIQGNELGLAGSLDPEACSKAQSEQKILSDTGITEDISKGYNFASQNLSKDRLQKIIRWFELEEQILFQCPRSKIKKPDPASPKGLAQDKIADRKSSNTSKPDPKSQPPKPKKSS